MSHVAKNIFPFATMTDGCKKVNLINFSIKFTCLMICFLEMVSKMTYSWKNPMKLSSLQPSATVAKGKQSFATMTHGCKGSFLFATMTDGCKEAYFMGVSHYICKK